MNKFNIWQQEANTFLEKHLHSYFPANEMRDIMEYSLIPAGKVFRPLIVYAVGEDTHKIESGHRFFASAIEFHHCYTLIHDDLPSMDNDLTRRGRPTSHIKFNEWKALLAGDALSIASFRLLAQLPADKIQWILKFFTWTTGSSGLIYGQFYDLSGFGQNSISNLKTMHTLKTARLLQLSIVGSYFLNMPLNLNVYKDLMYLGKYLGINFQLIDDFKDIEDASEHEKEVNPFFNFNRVELIQLIQVQHGLILKLCEKYKLSNLLLLYKTYYNKISPELTKICFE